MYGFHNAWDTPYMMGGWYGWLSIVGMVIFWAAIIAAIVFLVRWFKATGQGDDRKSALEILEERYAKGEIDKAEFEEKKKDLKKASTKVEKTIR